MSEEGVADFLARDEEEAFRGIEFGGDFVESAESDGEGVMGRLAAGFGWPEETSEVAIECGLGVFLVEGGLVKPAVAGLEDIMIGEAEEVVAIFAVPFGDDFGELVAIGPEGMGVEVTLIPLGLGVGV